MFLVAFPSLPCPSIHLFPSPFLSLPHSTLSNWTELFISLFPSTYNEHLFWSDSFIFSSPFLVDFYKFWKILRLRISFVIYKLFSLESPVFDHLFGWCVFPFRFLVLPFKENVIFWGFFLLQGAKGLQEYLNGKRGDLEREKKLYRGFFLNGK